MSPLLLPSSVTVLHLHLPHWPLLCFWLPCTKGSDVCRKRTMKCEGMEIMMKPSAEPAGQPQPNTLAKHAFPGGFSVPGGLERMETLVSIKPHHLLKSDSSEPLNMDKPRRKMWHQNRPRNHTCLTCTCSKQLPLPFFTCPVVFTTSKE